MLAGRYEIQRAIGAGGMGVVYEAVQLDLGRRVALKVLPRSPDPRDLARLRTEVLAVAAASHAHVVPIIECRDDHDPPFFVMELLHGLTLATVLRQGPMPVDRAVRIAVQVLSALSAAHAAGVVHRDIKPANVFLVQTPGVGDVVKVLDFGVAKLTDGSSSSTTTGSLVGTPAYMAPEQVLLGAIGPWTDIHAAGLLLFEMLTGRRPFEGAPTRMPYEPAPHLATFRGDVSPGLASVVACALEKDPSRRFPSAQVMIDALLNPLTQSGPVPSVAQPQPVPPQAAQHKGGSVLIFVVALLSVLLIGGVALAVVFGRMVLTPSSRAEPIATAPPSPPSDTPKPSATEGPTPSGSRPPASTAAVVVPGKTGTPADAGAPRADAGTTASDAGLSDAGASPPGGVKVAALVMSGPTRMNFSDAAYATLQRSAPAIVSCVNRHGGGRFGPGDQVSVGLVVGAGGKTSFLVGWHAKQPTGDLPEFTTCIEGVAGSWNVTPSAPKNTVYFNLS